MTTKTNKTTLITPAQVPGLPFDGYAYISVTFDKSNEDKLVPFPRDFRATTFSNIIYLVVTSDQPTQIYDSRTIPGGKAWRSDRIYLRSTTAPVTCTILVALKRRR